ncbi:MAG: hypothetical protein RQ745_06200 [Longimicrobiales bacterium]|nr:hypothetical protein [Longimicrobiales bacterium]
MKRGLTTIGVLALLTSPAALTGQMTPEAAEGAMVWARNCVRCHNARPSAERTDGEWLVIVNHMRARANLTKSQARMAAAFLQATNTVEAVPANAPAPEPDPLIDSEIEVETIPRPDSSGTLSAATLEHLRRYLLTLNMVHRTPSG